MKPQRINANSEDAKATFRKVVRIVFDVRAEYYSKPSNEPGYQANRIANDQVWSR